MQRRSQPLTRPRSCGAPAGHTAPPPQRGCGWWLGVLALWLCAAAAQAQAPTLVITAAEAVQADTPTWPEQAPAASVTLPDEWAQSRRGSAGPV